MKRNYLVISIIALSVLLFFEVTSVASLISEEKGKVTSSERSSQSFNQSEQSTNKNKSTETASVNESTQESVKSTQSQSTEPEPTQESTEAVQDPTVKSIAISFDDGPGATTTPQLLQILKEKTYTPLFCFRRKYGATS